MVQYAQEEKQIREENLRLQHKLQMEIERREALCRHLSESESSLEMEEERLVVDSHNARTHKICLVSLRNKLFCDVQPSFIEHLYWWYQKFAPLLDVTVFRIWWYH